MGVSYTIECTRGKQKVCKKCLQVSKGFDGSIKDGSWQLGGLFRSDPVHLDSAIPVVT